MGARLKFWRRSRVPKKGSKDEAVEFLAASPLVTAPPSNLTGLYYNGSAAKSHSTTTQYRQLRRLNLRRLRAVLLLSAAQGHARRLPAVMVKRRRDWVLGRREEKLFS